MKKINPRPDWAEFNNSTVVTVLPLETNDVVIKKMMVEIVTKKIPNGVCLRNFLNMTPFKVLREMWDVN